jgi:hypothetical protein
VVFDLLSVHGMLVYWRKKLQQGHQCKFSTFFGQLSFGEVTFGKLSRHQVNIFFGNVPVGRIFEFVRGARKLMGENLNQFGLSFQL